MISGTDLFLGLFNNLAIFIVLVAVYGALNSFLEQREFITRQVVLGIVFGLFAISCMYVKIPAAEGVIVDQRNTIVTLSGAFGGPLSALICAVFTGSYRASLGGAGVFSGVVGVGLSAVAGIILFKVRYRIDSLSKAFLGAMVATVIILPGFLLVGDFYTGLALMKAMALPYGLAIFLGISLVGLLLAHEEKRHLTEIELKKSEKRFRDIYENLIDVSYRTDSDGNFIAISPSSENTFGYRPEEIIGRQIDDFYKMPSRRKEFIEQILKEGRVQNFEAEIRKKDGSFVWVSTNAKILTDKNGSFKGIEGVTRDISQLKNSEEEKQRLEESLRQSQKMQAIGTLAGGIAHDFNNILAAIIGYTEMARDEIPVNSPAGRYTQQILNAGMRAKELTRHILTFSRQSEQNLTAVHIHQVVKEALNLLRATIPTTIEIRQQIDSKCGAIIADPIQLHQVVMNLCTNAAHAMEEKGGVLSVKLESLKLNKDDLKNDPYMKPGQYVQLSVNDTGSGIGQKDITRVFDPYFTTKEVGKGSGLGLSVVHGIVKRHNGMIKVESDPNTGTTFSVYFPKTDLAATKSKKDSAPLPTGTERILLVDDEIAVAEVMGKRLEQLGYQVASKNCSLEALELFRTKPNAFDLVITDQTMPHLTGDRFAKEVIDLRPDILVILCSGYSSIVDAEKAKGIGIKDFIMKPVDQNELAFTVRRVLDEKRRS